MFGRSCLVLIGFVSVVKAAVPPIPKATFSTSAVDTKGVHISSLTSREGITFHSGFLQSLPVLPDGCLQIKQPFHSPSRPIKTFVTDLMENDDVGDPLDSSYARNTLLRTLPQPSGSLAVVLPRALIVSRWRRCRSIFPVPVLGSVSQNSISSGT